MQRDQGVAAVKPRNKKLVNGLIVLAVGAIIWFCPVPAGLKPEGWHLLAIFMSVILGFIIKPIPAGALTLLGVGFSALTEILTPAQVLSGFGNGTIWTIVSAFLLSAGFIKTGLGRRIAYLVIYFIGDKTLKLMYAILIGDLIIAPGIPSNGARLGGVFYPIIRSLCSAFGSEPGPTARKVGSFLMMTTYHSEASISTMFMTASAANLLVAALAASTIGVKISWVTWTVAALLPGVASLLIVPYFLFRVYPPEIKETPQAKEMARAELEKMGKIKIEERLLLGIFVTMLVLWCTYQITNIDAVVVAILGGCAMVITNVITWDDVLSEKKAWDTLIWMGGTIALADGLTKLGTIAWFAKVVSGSIAGINWPLALFILVLAYFYIHYIFANVAAHITALYPAFITVAVAAGAPPFLVAITLGFASMLTMPLTHYASAPAPIFFGAGYVDQGTWWKYGFAVSVITLVIWAGIGLPWWKYLGLW
ncbi:MAG: anion permease [Negativicutes bacterium]|nr:anion permease [Negativicutes bacterium]